MNGLQQVKYNGDLILTTEQLADFYGTTVNRIIDNFHENKDKFINGKHYYALQGNKLRKFKRLIGNSDKPLVNKYASQLVLWTKRGASRHSKMLGTDKAWDMFDELEENYFNPRSEMSLPDTPEAQLHLLMLNGDNANQRISRVEDGISHVKDAVRYLKEDQVLSNAEYGEISRRINQRVSEVGHSLGHITQKQRGELFKDINGGIKRIANVGARSMLRRKHYRLVMDFITDWEPSTATKTLIRQMSLDI